MQGSSYLVCNIFQKFNLSFFIFMIYEKICDYAELTKIASGEA